jgi:hypothetical protein
MPLFLDVHKLEGATSDAVAGAHQRDIEIFEVTEG